VLATEVFEHVFELDHTLQEINRVMKPGGKILLSAPFVFMEHEIPYDFARYSSYGMRAVLERNGFQVLALDKTSNYVEVLCLMGLLYLNNTFVGYLHVIPLVGNHLRTFFICLLNIASVILSKIMPVKKDWYLGLVVLAQKEE